ncbi:MAG TPA: prolyl oligopeptidase family serine peptidase [Gemmataceae bacterium]|nr:prolyl oligopeptidase family serine peptidase [Gemmataceae bacterium]
MTAALIAASLLAAEPIAPAPDQPTGLSKEIREQLLIGLSNFNQHLAQLDSKPRPDLKADYMADAEVFAKGVVWALHYDTEFQPADVALLKKAVERADERIRDLPAKPPWADRKGKLVRGFVSAVDGSVQPYGLIVPSAYDPAKPIRLDVVLHGSSKPVGMSELRFMSRFDEGDGEAKNAPDQDWIELHPLGRVENCYRWAGETDVFEAIEAVCRNYNIDRDRIVLRGMSMGASGTWHLGLKHPDLFVALGPYCGYVDTHHFSETPLPNFVKVGPLPDYQEKGLHMLDSIDYAANAGAVPVVACMGDKDVFFQAHVLMGEAMEKEGLKLNNIISPGTGHTIDPAAQKEELRQIGDYAVKGLDHALKKIRFVTWTLKYSRCYWLQILGMEQHYARAEIEAEVADDGTLNVKEPSNITRFAVFAPMLQERKPQLRVGGVAVALPERDDKAPPRTFVIGRRNGEWACLGDAPLSGKRPGLQGPIDDAFTTPFLCVRGTGKAWNPAVQAWADANLKRFSYEWNRYFRGELPVKDDTAVTDEDVRRCNLVLFGDPGSNPWIARVLPNLPVQWTRDGLRIRNEKYGAGDHAPVLIQPNPLAEGRYVVLNSGHTFHEKELSSLNYLLFPRLGDWAVFQVGGKQPDDPSQALDETLLQAGFFNEAWQFPEADENKLAPFFHPPKEYADDFGDYKSPLKFYDGTPVKTAQDWQKRRQEIRSYWMDAMGPWPPLIEKPMMENLETEKKDGYTQRHIRLEVAPGWTSDDAYLLVPNGDGPFPAVVVVFYDAKTGVGLGDKPGRDFARQLAKRGFVALSLGSDPNSYFPDKKKAQLQPLSFHAYMAANCYNALANLPQVDPKRIGIVGHSYGGKWAMFASCLFDKFACAAWSDPGIVFDEKRSNVNYWEPWYLGYEPDRERKPGIPDDKNPRTGPYKKLIEEGHDLTELHALMAPRPFLVSGGSEDGPERWKALNHAVAVNKFLGYEDRAAMTNRADHPPTDESNEQLCLFFERFLKREMKP